MHIFLLQKQHYKAVLLLDLLVKISEIFKSVTN